MNLKLLSIVASLSSAAWAAPPVNVAQSKALRPLPDYLYGVTTDAVDHLSNIVTSLKKLPKTPTVRIVFDEWVPATYYQKAVTRIYPYSYIMGELLDSSAVKSYSLQQYSKRAQEYISLLGDKVDIWEIGNEINGEWLGGTQSVVAKMKAAYDIANAAGKRTELTLYYNPDCWADPKNEMFRWAANNVPTNMKQELDYVLVSYYEDDCNNFQPDWPAVMQQLGAMFPNSKIGIGEVGTRIRSKKKALIRKYYTMTINHPQYVGGNFWWYFKQDMVPYTKRYWKFLYDALVAGP